MIVTVGTIDSVTAAADDNADLELYHYQVLMRKHL